MSDKNTVTMLSEEFENDKTGEKVEGITIIVDGKLKEVLDLIKIRNKNYNNYTEILRDALFEGINNITNKSKE
ncbi:hypothetical protein SAMN05444401_3300 [Clostridium amylolyticum]|uniref:Uncharacterized protein n=1 Tax=Clostridium amylolyticum TaxID=1121298 RepID=A0A1M6KBU3_9CLOT|nr:hypothetical protein [Clostridium amylolyticum]SHJ56349.1 hypothetical protein SAMN05444401_3300 [Clostridium amylolyticum]